VVNKSRDRLIEDLVIDIFLVFLLFLEFERFGTRR